MNLEKILRQMREAPHNVRYADVVNVCTVYFGEPRQQGTSHYVLKRRGPETPASMFRTGTVTPSPIR